MSTFVPYLAVGLVLSVGAAVASADNGTFGNTTPGGASQAPDQGYKIGSTYHLADTATLQSFKFYASGGSGSEQTQSFIPAVYDASGALVATGAPVVVAAGSAPTWHQSALTGDLLPGDYTLALVTGPANQVAPIYFDSGVNGVFNTNSYAAGPSTQFGAAAPSGQVYSFYVNYTTQAPQGAAPQASTYRPEPARGAYCAVTGDADPRTGNPIPAGTFLNLGLGQPAVDAHYQGAVPAFYVQGVGLTCDPPPAGVSAAVGNFVDQVGKTPPPGVQDPGAIYPYFKQP